MELKIYSPQDNRFAQAIQWNFTELKQEIAETVQGYEVSVYTDDAIKQAKADRAKLRKFVEALEAKRREIKKKYLEPYEEFEREEKELTAMVQKAIDNIDSQVKAFEERLRAEKTEKIREFYEDNIHDIGAYLPFERIFKPEYANATTSMKSIKEEMLALIQKVDEGLAVLNEMDSPYAGDMKAVFLRTYDIGAALTEKNRLEAAERKRQEYEVERLRQKAEREAREKEEAQNVINAGRKEVETPPPVVEPHQEEKIETQPEQREEPKIVLDFRVQATKGQLEKLKAFLLENQIQFGPVPKQ